MSNIKQVLVSGHVPFNLADHPNMARKLAFFNTPTSGLKIEYGAQYEMRQNAHGGQTAMYPFCVKGEEAVSASYIQSFIDDVYAIGGKVTGATVTDIENNETCKVDFKKIQFPVNDRRVYTTACGWQLSLPRIESCDSLGRLTAAGYPRACRRYQGA
jgi:hypothetical protein